MNVLILGNGISRLAYHSFIDNWIGEAWGCNRAYIDYGEKLTVLAGHVDVMHDAKKYRGQKKLTYKIIGGHLGEDPSADFSFSCNKKYQENTGSAIAAEALTQGHDIVVVGFDMGGRDVYSPNHDAIRKTCWVNRWRWMIQEFGESRIHFIGHDHKPFLLSNRPASEYWDFYKKGKPHIPGKAYAEIYEKWQDSKRFFDGSEKVCLQNIGQRNWEIYGVFLEPGKTALLPEGIAVQYTDRYRRDFRILKENESGNDYPVQQRTQTLGPDRRRRQQKARGAR